MKTRLLHLWDSVRASYWFIPTLFAASALFLSAATLAVDGAANRRTIQSLGWMYHGGPDGARALLSTVAGSMIGIAGVTFSVTIVALSLASGQFGPRLLRNFMRDTGNQVVLGTFVATFLYCLLILRAVQGMDGDIFVPHVSVTFGLGLAVVSVGVLIYFFHHVAESIQADNVIAAVGQDLHEAIDRLFLSEMGQGAPAAGRPKATADIPCDFDRTARPVLAPTTGYLQAIDSEGLMAIARENDLVLWLKYRPSDFIPAESEIALASPGEQLTELVTEKIQGTFILGTRRTPVQDVEFAVNQLVEVALRALSPGINDPFTAVTCID